MSWDFFISFSTKDKDRVSQIVRTMENHGASCWFQLRDSKQDYDKAIINGIRNCGALVLFLSPNSAKSTPVKNEVKFAQERANKKILPIVLTGDILDEAYDEISMLVAMKNILNVKDYKNDEELTAKIFDQLDFVPPTKPTKAVENNKPTATAKVQPAAAPKVQAKTEAVVKSNNQTSTFKTKYPDKICDNEFKDNKSLTIVVIPNGVTKIGRNAFRNCSNLTSVTIPDSVTYISWNAFDGCTKLANINFPSGETLICYQAFNETAWFNSQPDGVVYAGKVAYQYKGVMPKNATVTIKDGTLSIAAYSFYECQNLAKLVMPDSVLSICTGAFSDCANLSDIKISNNVTMIDDGAFKGCTSLISIDIPSSVEDVFSCTFQGCTSLTGVTLSNGLTEVGSLTFADCTALTGIVIPDGVETIGNCAFEGCAALNYVVIPDSVTTIDDEAFNGCNSLSSIIIPNSVEYVGSYIFINCDNLKYIYCEAEQNDVEDLWAHDWLEGCNATVIWEYKHGGANSKI